jgi:hypothetical protein
MKRRVEVSLTVALAVLPLSHRRIRYLAQIGAASWVLRGHGHRPRVDLVGAREFFLGRGVDILESARHQLPPGLAARIEAACSAKN